MPSVTLVAASRSIMLVLLLLLVGTSASAQVPGRVPFQGLLLDAGGAPVNGAVDLDFELHDALSGGASLWSETHLGVSVVDGVYSVDLGSVTPLSSGILGAGTAFLEIAVDGETLVPRTQFLSVPYALVSENVGSVSSAIVEQMIEDFPFDGQEPGNLHPDEGILDSDGDGIANFVDPDNDNDGLPDSVEFANGTALNLVTPSVSTVLPTTITGFCLSTLTVSGTSFDSVSTVSFGAEAPTPYGVTSSQLSIDVTAPTTQPSGIVDVVLANGESAVSPAITIRSASPSITVVGPLFAPANQAGTLVVTGTDFCAGTTVTLGSQLLVPTSVTETSIVADYAPESEGQVTVRVNHPSGATATASTPFLFTPIDGNPKVVFLSQSSTTGTFGSVAAADAICQTEAVNAGIGGTFRAWLSNDPGSVSPSSPATTFDQTAGPYLRVDAVVVADDWADLVDGQIAQPINLTASGNLQTTGLVWTGTDDDGTGLSPAASFTCNDWTQDVGALGMVGTPASTLNWTTAITTGCATSARFYCFEQ